MHTEKSFQEYSVEHMTILDLYLVNVEASAEFEASLGYTVSSKVSLDGRVSPCLKKQTSKRQESRTLLNCAC